MNRPIKYRAWDTREGLFAGVRISDNGKISALEYDHIEEAWYYKEDNDNRYILEQYTGLKDKNGKEIYEGDIVKCEGDVAVVIWREKQAEFGIRWADCGVEDELDYWNNLRGPSEVIGNIHENPELLGGEE